MQVKLLAYPKLTPDYPTIEGLTEADSVVAYAVSKCYRSKPNPKAIRRCFENGHTSVFEHIAFTFEINDISRACLAQLTRHRIASYSVESQRYVNYRKKDIGKTIPLSMLAKEDREYNFMWAWNTALIAYNNLINIGVPPEDARFVLPQAVATNLVMTINARSLFNFFNLRLDEHAQWEIRELARKMLELVKAVAPVTFEKFGRDD